MPTGFELSAESAVAIAAASPQLRTLDLFTAELSCHPAVVCAIVGGYCEHIESINVIHACTQTWSDIREQNVAKAYRSAVAAAGRSDAYQPFTQLRRLRVPLRWCTPPSMWHALLSLLRWAERVQCMSELASNDPLVVCALRYLPSLTSLSDSCRWPSSFATVMRRRSARTGQHRYLATQAVGWSDAGWCREMSTSH